MPGEIWVLGSYAAKPLKKITFLMCHGRPDFRILGVSLCTSDAKILGKHVFVYPGGEKVRRKTVFVYLGRKISAGNASLCTSEAEFPGKSMSLCTPESKFPGARSAPATKIGYCFPGIREILEIQTSFFLYTLFII